MTCREAIEAVFEKDSETFTTKDVISRINSCNPKTPWKNSTISAHLIGLSVNHPSARHYPSLYKHAFLYSLGNGHFRRLKKGDAMPSDTPTESCHPVPPIHGSNIIRPATYAIKSSRAESDGLILHKIFGIVGFFDEARWLVGVNYSSINFCDPQLSNDSKILTHWLCYITDRQMGFERIWDVGGFVFSDLVEETKKSGSLSLLDPDHEGSFFIKRKDYSYKGSFFKPEDDEKYIFVSHQQPGNNPILREYGFDRHITPFFLSRYYPSDYLSILFTLCALEAYDFSLAGYIKRLLETVARGDHLLSKLLFGLYLLTYEGVGQPKHADIAFGKNLRTAEKRAQRIEKVLSDLTLFTQQFKEFRGHMIFRQKRAWCSLRDYLKSPEFSRYFFAALDDQGCEEPEVMKGKDVLLQLELPGDVWNNNPKFRKCIFKGTRYEKSKGNFPELLRKICDEGDNGTGYPEQFDVTFDFVPRMCQKSNCDLCVIGRVNGKGKDFDKVCIRDTNKFCPVALMACNYRVMCLGDDCPIRKLGV